MKEAGPVIALAAGGTGGHVFPACVLADKLKSRGHETLLLTDTRGARYLDAFKGGAHHVLPAATISGKNPWTLFRAALIILHGVLKARRALKASGASAMVGFGGYPSLPPVIAAWTLSLPIVLQEQNAVLGRANRLLSKVALKVSTAVPKVRGADAIAAHKLVNTGLPLRPEVIACSGSPYPAPENGGLIRLLVFGGSQGASVLTRVVPASIALLPEPLRQRLQITQQCRDEEAEALGAAYQDIGLKVELSALFSDLPARMAASHLVISRAGASTVAELGAIGCPALLVPLASSLDQDQRFNALQMVEGGGASLVNEAEFTPENLAAILEEWLADPAQLVQKAALQKAFGRLDGAEALADLVVAELGMSQAEKGK